MTLAGGDDVVCDTAIEAGFADAPEWTCAPTAPDPRIKAIVPLDGSNQCLRWNELGRIGVPVLGMGEEWTAVLDWQARQHAAFSSRPAYRVDVAQTGHVQFADFCPAYQLLTDRGYLDPAFNEFIQTSYCTGVQPVGVMRSLIGKYAAAFLKTNLSGEPGYQPLLTPGWALTHETAIEFFVTERKSAQSIAQEWPELFVYFAHQSGSSQARGEKNPKKPLPVVHLEGLR